MLHGHGRLELTIVVRERGLKRGYWRIKPWNKFQKAKKNWSQPNCLFLRGILLWITSRRNLVCSHWLDLGLKVGPKKIIWVVEGFSGRDCLKQKPSPWLSLLMIIQSIYFFYFKCIDVTKISNVMEKKTIV